MCFFVGKGDSLEFDLAEVGFSAHLKDKVCDYAYSVKCVYV